MDVRPVTLADLHPSALDELNRYQVTTQVKYFCNGNWLVKNDRFLEHWDKEKKAQVIYSLRNCIQAGGFVAGAFKNGVIIGFANIESALFGENSDYLELPYIHVSYEYRGQGLGRKLFQLCCQGARKRGAKKLYIAAHPAVETQEFYAALGCVPAAEINAELLAREPRDIQLECVL